MKEYDLAALRHLPDVWQRIQEENRPLVVYGMGNGADKLFARLAAIGKQVAAVFASDGFVRGQSFRSYPVLRFSEIKEKYPDFLILQSFATRQRDVMENLFQMAGEYDLVLPDMPVVEGEDFDSIFFNAHFEEIQETYDLLEDKLSKQIYFHSVLYKLTGDIRHLRSAFSTEEEDFAPLSALRIQTAIDGGAYNGDTVRVLLAYHPETARIFAVEPDPRTYRKLTSFIENAALSSRVIPIHAALWDKDGEAFFAASGNRNSSLVSASYEHKTEPTTLTTVDAIAKDTHVDYIKYDLEGAEYEALVGSLDTIRRDRPALAISLYHRSADLFRLPLFVRRLGLGYRFYLRRPPCLPAWELTLYAVPDHACV